MNYPSPEHFPGTLYDGDGVRLAGNRPIKFTAEVSDALPFKAMIHDADPSGGTINFGPRDRFWLLPDTLGTPPQLPQPLLAELTNIIRAGGGVGLAARSSAIGAQVRDVILLLLDEPGGRK